MLLDLHNLYANACNFGLDPFAMLDALPLERVASVHLSGGHREDGPDGRSRLIDDHVHDPPPILYAMLRRLAARAPQSLTVIIERDGYYPEFGTLLEQIADTRTAMAEGRAQRRRAGLEDAA
jgi:hypothetical protein